MIIRLVAKERAPLTPEQVARNNRVALAICTVFFGLAAVTLGAYAFYSHQDYAARTTPPGGRTTVVTVDDVQVGRSCTGRSGSCSPEYTLGYTVDGVRHTTPVRIDLHAGDQVHAFRGTNGHWYVTEDPGFGNSSVAWLIWAGAAVGALAFALVCARGWARYRRAR